MERFSEKVVEHFLDPQNRGTLEQPSGTGLAGMPGEGPYMVFQVRSCDGLVNAACFQCHNCGATVACGSVLTTLVIGRTLEDCLQLTAQDIFNALGGLPPDKLHTAQFAILAMHQAIKEATA